MLRALAIVAGLFAADDGPRKLEVDLGKTTEVEVGYTIGFRCDDPAVVEASMKSKSEDTNVFVVTGRREGTTLCRVGTDPQRPSILFEIRVVAPKQAPAKRRLAPDRQGRLAPSVDALDDIVGHHRSAAVFGHRGDRPYFSSLR